MCGRAVRFFITLYNEPKYLLSHLVLSSLLVDVAKREGICHGFTATITSNDYSIQVIPFNFGTIFINWTQSFSRDPAQHSALASQIESQSTAYYSTARLWDDGIIRPVDTRDTLGLALNLSRRKDISNRHKNTESTTWDGEGRGFGVFRMWRCNIS